LRWSARSLGRGGTPRAPSGFEINMASSNQGLPRSPALRAGLIGWRGMVGSVLLQRMRAEGDFALVDPVFFSTSQAGAPAPDVGGPPSTLLDANDIAALAACDVLISCQGGDYTGGIHPKLRAAGWDGYWIDAASTLR